MSFSDAPATPEPPTATTLEQAALEQSVRHFYEQFSQLAPEERREHLALRREAHVAYAAQGLAQLPSGFVTLDASRPWLVFWLVHTLALLQAPLPSQVGWEAIAAFLKSCQSPDGGFGGGPQQLPHLAPTYAALAALTELGEPEALAVVDRRGVAAFIQRMAVPPEQGGGFRVCYGGEVDVRGCYTAMAAAHMLCLDKAALAGRAGMVDFVCRCQTYEGGIGGEPGNEAHGGYTYCGLAALGLVGAADALHLPRLLHWAARCQGQMEGGFMGRTNKLVDGCYSFWQGALFSLLQRLSPQMLAQTRVPRLPQPLGIGTVIGESSSAHVGAAPGGRLGVGGVRSGNECVPIVVLPPPMLSGVGPSAVAVQRAEAAKVAAERAVQSVIEAQAGGNGGGQAGTGGGSSGAANVPSGRLAALCLRQAVDKASAIVEASTAADSYAAAMLVSAAELLSRGVLSPPSGTSTGSAIPQGVLTQCTVSTERSARNGNLPAEGGLGGRSTPGGQQPAESNIRGLGAVEAGGGDGLSAHLLPGDFPPLLYSPEALQLWLLQCCQQLRGGLRDKPGKPVDYYHTCYCLSGLASSQHSSGVVLGPEDNLLARIDPLCNVLEDRLQLTLEYFSTQRESMLDT